MKTLLIISMLVLLGACNLNSSNPNIKGIIEEVSFAEEEVGVNCHVGRYGGMMCTPKSLKKYPGI